MTTPKSYQMLQRVFSIITITVMILSLFNGTVRPVQAANAPAKSSNPIKNIAPASSVKVNPVKAKPVVSETVKADSDGHTIEASVNGTWLHGWGWEDGASITLTVDDPSNGTGVDYTDNTTVGPLPWDPGNSSRVASFENSHYQLKPGDIVTMTDGVTPHTMTLADIQVTNFNLVGDIITGSAPADTQVIVCANSDTSGCINRYVTSTGSGAWTVNFHIAGTGQDSPETVDIQAGMNGWARIDNSQGDQSYYNWDIPNPFIEASPSDSWIHGRNWPNGAELTLTIDNPANGSGVDFSTSAVMQPNPNNPGDPNDIRADFNLGTFSLVQGMQVTVTDGVTARSMTIAPDEWTATDAVNNTVSGITDHDAQVHVWADTPDGSVGRWATADADGHWTADYGHTGGENDDPQTVDLYPWSDGTIEQRDASGNVTMVHWKPAHFIVAFYNGTAINAFGWPYGTEVTMNVDDPSNGTGSDYSSTATEGQASWIPASDSTFIVAELPVHDYVLQPGMQVTMTGGGTSRSMTLFPLSISNIDFDTDVITGVTGANITVQVRIDAPGHSISRWAMSDGSGNWSVDFHHPGGPGNDAETFDLTPSTNSFLVAASDADGNMVHQGWWGTHAFVEASPNGNWVHGRGWKSGTPLTLTVDDPNNGVGVDYTANATMGQAPWNPGDPNDIVADFPMHDFHLQPGMLLSVTDGTTARTLTLSDIQVTSVNADTDTVSGVTSSNHAVQVCINISTGCNWRFVTADDSGHWSANYSNPGGPNDDPDTYDIKPGDSGWAADYDSENNHIQTFVDWKLNNPRIEGDVADNWVKGRDWPTGSVLTLTIAGTDLSANATVEHNPDNPGDSNDIRAQFNLGDLHLQPGMQLTVTDGTTSRMLTLTGLTASNFDVENDTISGTTDSPAGVRVCVNQPGKCVTRWATPDGEGHWTVNFHTAGGSGEDPETVDLQPGFNGVVDQYDSSSNATHIDWNIKNPFVEANVKDHWVHGREWPDGIDLTLTIDDPSNGAGVDYTTIARMAPPSWDPQNTNAWDRIAEFELGNFQLQPGQVLTITDGTTVKSLTIVPLSITNINPEDDTVSGTATPGAAVNVCINMPNRCINRWVTANEQGTWIAHYSVAGGPGEDADTVNIDYGTNGWAAQSDNASNRTWVDWQLQNPYVEASTEGRWVHGRGWDKGTLLTLSIDDPDNGVGEDFHATATVGQASWNPNDIVAEFDPGNFQLRTGMRLTITDGITPRTLTLSPLQITNINVDTDIISGVSSPNLLVQVCVNLGDRCLSRSTTADGSGDWQVNYQNPGGPGEDSGTYDIQPGANGWAADQDSFGNQTHVDWKVLNPYVEASVGSHWVHGRDWPTGTVLTLTVAGSSFSATATVEHSPDNPGDPNDIGAFFNLGDFQLHAGLSISVTDNNGTTKVLAISPLQVTGFDVANDTVSGTTDPNARVQVCINQSNRCITRWVTANDQGHWTADYHVAGGQGDDPDTVDLKPGANGWAAQEDDASNKTWVDWQLSGPSTAGVLVDVLANAAYANNWEIGKDVTISFDDPNNGIGWDFSVTQTASQGSCGWCQFSYQIDPNLFKIKAGDLVRITDGVTTKEFSIPDVVVTGADPATGIYQGTAPSGSEVNVKTYYFKAGGSAERNGTAGGNGHWSVDFAHTGIPDTDQDIFTLKPGQGFAWVESYTDPQHSLGVKFNWGQGPYLLVYPKEPRVESFGWPIGVDVTLSVDDPETPQTPDHTYHATAIDDGGMGNLAEFDNLDPLLPGFIITISDGAVTKSTIINDFAVTYVERTTGDHFGSQMSGTAQPGTDLAAHIWANGDAYRVISASTNGQWQVDFAVPGSGADEQGTGILYPGTDGNITAFDTDGDGTRQNFNITNARFSFWRDNDHIDGYGWPKGAMITLTITYPGDPDFSVTKQAAPTPWDPNGTSVQFNPGEVPHLKPGQVAIMTDGINTITETVTNLEVTSMDVDSDTVSGTADPGSTVWVQVTTGDGAYRTAIADPDGSWSVDFAHPNGIAQDMTFDIVANTEITIEQKHANGCSTAYHLTVESPYIEASAAGRWAQSRGWPLGTSLTLTITGTSFSNTATVDHDPNDPGNPNNILVRFDLGDFQLQAGMQLNVTDGTTTRSLTLSSLHITHYDVVNDTISGVTEPGARVQVCANAPDYCKVRWTTADPNGDWTVNYQNPGGPGEDAATVDLQPGSSGWAAQYDDNASKTQVDWWVPNPSLTARMPDNQIQGFDWPLGASVTLTVEDSGTQQSPDYTATHTVTHTPWDSNQNYVEFYPDNLTLKPGQVLTLSDGSTTRTLTIAALNVTVIDTQGDTVSGTAPSGAVVYVNVNCDPNGCPNRHAIANENGDWMADFSQPGTDPNEQVNADIQLGTEGEARINGEDNVSTIFHWRMPNPRIVAFPDNNNVGGDDWPLNTPILLSIVDPSRSQEDPWQGHAYAAVNNGNPNATWINFELGNYDLKADDVLTMSYGNVTKTLTITTLSVSAINPQTDTISGDDAPGANIEVWIDNANPGVDRWVQADPSGHWFVDFSTPSPESSTYALIPGTSGQVKDYDQDGDSTQTGWRVNNPYIQANVGNQWVQGRDWPLGTQLTLTVTGTEFSSPAMVVHNPNNPNDPNDIAAYFDLGDFRLQSGMQLNVTDGVITKSLTLAPLQATHFDVDNDTISGTAGAHARVQVCANVPNRCITRWVTADGDGNWTANYKVAGTGDDDPDTVDLQPGSNGWAAQTDAASNQTWLDWNVPNPYIEANAASHWVHARGWPFGSQVTLTINDPTTPDEVDYSTTGTMGPAPWNPNDPNDIVADFDLANFQLHSGMLLHVTDGLTERTLTLSILNITNIDVEADTVSGTTSPNRQVQVCLNMPNNCISRWTTADDSGHFTVNYRDTGANQNDSPETHDIQPGDNGWAKDNDLAGNQTQFDWKVLSPYIEVDVANRWLHGREWPTDAVLTLTIHEPNTPASSDFTQTATMVQAPWNPGDPNDIVADFDLRDYQLRPGMLVNVTDGTTSRTMTVADVHITQFDVDNDLIYGVADPGARLQVCANITNGCITRWVTAASDGTWMADYHNPGGQGEDLATVDLQPGSSGWAAQKDGPGYQTWLDWQVPNPHMEAWVEEQTVIAIDWPVNANLTLTIHHPGTPTSEDYTTSEIAGPAQYGNTSMTWFVLGSNLHAGDAITLTDGQTSRTYTATNLHVDFIDYLTESVSGFGADNGAVTVVLSHDNNNCQRTATADPSGNWSVDFRDTSNGQSACEIQHGEEVKAFQPDGQHDTTVARLNAPNTHIDVWFAEDKVFANDFPANTLLTLTIQDDLGLQVYTTAGTSDTQTANPHLGGVTFMLNGAFDIQPGQTVTVSGGGYTRTTLVRNLTLTAVNVTTDQVTGTADTGSNMWGCAFVNGCTFRRMTPDAQGNWVEDFSVPGENNSPTLDLVPGMSGMVNIQDDQFNNTSLAWNVPLRTLHANPKDNEVHGHDWPIGDSVTLTIDDDNNPLNGVLYSRTQTVVNDSTACGMPCFNLQGTSFTLQTGQVVSMSDAAVTKIVTVSSLHITGVDYVHDIVRGTAGANSSVMVNIWSQNGIARQVTSDGSGNWQVDFSVTGDQDFEQTTADIVFGDNGRAIQLNADGSDDGTLEYWGVPFLPAAFTKTGPANAAINQPLNLTLTWNASEGAQSYQYCYDTSNNDTCSGAWTGTTETSADLSGLSAGFTYYWQVRALNSSGNPEADNGTWWSFTTLPLPGSLGKSSPADVATNQVLSLSLSWASSSNAASYQYCYDTTNNTTCEGTWTSTTATSASINGLARNTTYYWQVKAVNGSGTLDANSATWWSFTTIPNVPASFGKSAPTNGAANQSITPSISWTASTGAVSYQYCYDTSNNGICDGSWTDTTAPSASLTGLTYSTFYYWQVRAVNPGGTTEANSTVWWSFSTLPQAPDNFTKASPIDQAMGLDLTPTLSWAATARADSYQYCVSFTSGSCNSWTTTTNTSVTLSTALNPGIRYYWQVQALNAGGVTPADGGAWHSFTTQNVPGSFDKLGPANGSTNQPLNLSLTWETSPSATSYQYCYSVTNGTCATWRSAASNNAAVTGLARNTVYYWQVRAINSSGNTTANGGTWWSFTTIPNLPAAFNKSAPANAAINQSLTPTLSWAASAGAVSYQYCYDTTSSTTCDGSWQDAGTALSVVLPALNYSTTYYWQVRATNPGGTTDANAATWWSFTTLPQAPADFGKSSPAENAAEVSTKPTLSWAPSLWAASYQYCYDTSDDDTCNGVWTSTTATSVTLSTTLTAGATYYWQVRAFNPNTSTDADSGTWWSFTTLAQPDAFGKAAPATGSVDQQLTLNLSWNSSSDVDHYEYCYDTTNDNACTTWTSTNGTTVALSGLARNTTYYWEVRAANSNGKTPADGGTYSNFTTIPVAPAAFAKSAPLNAAASQSVSLALGWAPSSGAAAYEYCLDTTNNAACDTGWVNVGTDRSVNPAELTYSTTYYWQVHAINPGGMTNANAGSWWSFTTQVAPLNVFTKTNPSNGSAGVGLNPTLSWTASSGATSYSYCYDTTDDNHCDGTQQSVTGTSATLSGLAAGTTYYWQVSAVNSSNSLEADNGNWFSFKTLPPPPGAFLKVSPPTAATNQPLVNLPLDWEASSDADYYEYCYDTTNDSACSTWTSTSATNATLSGLALNTTYYWQVRAVNSSSKTVSNGGTWWSFKTQPPAPTAFSKSAPANNTSGVALTTSLTWASAGVVDNYSYCLTTNSSATCDGSWIDMGTARTVTPSGLHYATTYYWQVRAKNSTDQIGANTGTWWSFTTVMPPTPPVPVLVSPVNAATITDYTPVLDWNDVSYPVSDHPDVLYDVQVSTVSTFNADTLIYDEQTGDSSFQISDTPALDPGHTYYWHVRSVNYLGGYSAWVVRSFKTGWLPPVLGDPVDSATPDSNRPVFTWQAVDQATSYTLQISKVSSFSTTALSVTVTGTTYNPTADLPVNPANPTLYWRMRTAGTNGPSAWSDYNQFQAPNPPAIPTLSTPATGTLVNTYTPKLEWSTVSLPTGTAFGHYDLEVSKDSSFGTTMPIDPITDKNQSSYTFPSTLDDNATYFWRVRVINDSKQHCSWSSVFSFRTPMRPPALDLLVDGGHALTVRPQFIWEAVDTATGYTIQVSKYSTFASTVVNTTVTGLNYIPTSDLPRYAAGVTTLLYWRVKANGANPSAWSDYNTFTPANPPAVPTLTGPATGTVTSDYTPLFSWGSVGPASGYEIQFATTSAFADGSLIDPSDHGLTSTNSYTPPSDLPDNVTLYWRVRSLNPAGEYSFWSASRSIKTTLPAPALLVPVTDGSKTTFKWGDVADATNYTIQVSTVSTFSSTLVNKTVTEATFSTLTALPHNKPLYWRVRANGTVPSLWASSNFTITP